VKPVLRVLGLVALALLVSACGMRRAADNLPYGLVNNDDPALVAAALPAWIVTVDGLLVTWPERESLLLSGSKLYAAYATLNGTDPGRQQRHTSRALDYALRAACAHRKDACDLRSASFPEFEAVVKDTKKRDLPLLYALGSAWGGYVQANSGDWNAIAELARVQAIFERIIAIDPGHENGMPHLYLGVVNSLLPPSLGGKPDVAKGFYEEAIRRSGGENLYAKLMYAKQYARLLYDRDLHDRLLGEVLAANPNVHGWTLSNVYAQEEARRLLASADDYF
jgi:hypothetical protein